MILITRDPSGQKKYFAGFYRDCSICWTIREDTALDKKLGELKAIATRAELPAYQIRERLPNNQTFSI